ncbi:MAG: hypothetical protein HKN47_09470, partial [Pirellulaceae bacterium]|nr:hypothetical protein [Pirellulaceae bacterium]
MLIRESRFTTRWPRMQCLQKPCPGLPLLAGMFVLPGLFVLLCASVGRADEPQLRLRLKDGTSFVDGQLKASQANDRISIKSPLLEQPVTFDVRSVRSIAGDYSPDVVDEGHIFLLEGGTRISGALKSWNQRALQVESPSLGLVQLRRSKLRSVEAAEDTGTRVYSGPKSIDDWLILDDTDKWTFAAGALKSPDLEAKAAGNVQLPKKFRLVLSMSWDGRADFVMSLGCKEQKKKPKPAADEQARVRRSMVQPTQESAAVRLEMWDAQLAVVREVGNLADIAVLPLDDGVSKFDMVFYIDQIAGLVAVYSPRGKMLEKIRVAEDKGQAQSYALLENHGKSVSLDRFDVYEWDGHLPDSTEYPDSYLLDKDGTVINAEVIGFDAQTGELQLVDPEGTDQQIPLEDVRRILLVEDVDGDDVAETEIEATDGTAVDADSDTQGTDTDAEDTDADDQDTGDTDVDDAAQEAAADDRRDVGSVNGPTFESIAMDESRLIEVDIADSSRLVGYLVPAKKSRFGFRSNGVAGVVSCDADQIVAMTGSALRFTPDPLPGLTGILTTPHGRLQGCLVETTDAKQSRVLRWQAWASDTPAAISPDQSGSITYVGPSQSAARNRRAKVVAAVPVERPRGLGELIGGIFGAGGDPPDGNKAGGNAKDAMEKPKPQFEIVFRSGDTVDGVVESVDDRGVTFRSSETTTKFVPHDKMDSITLARMTSKPAYDPAKLKRLLTVPRANKDDPPTHLFVSTNGDYLRGRLVGINAEKVGVEVRLSVQEIPRDKIARVIWLHERPWLDDKQTAAEDKSKTDLDTDQANDRDPEQVAGDAIPQILVHAVRPDKRGVTFVPKKLVDGTLIGVSDLLGDCKVQLESIDSLLFGPDVGEKALALRKESWKLSLAALPKAYLESAGGDGSASSSGVQSPLVGKEAPEIRLDTIDGERFVLTEQRGRVVVLDFWASW